ncbi:Hsp70 family protein [Rhodococcus sp. P1Y]|uniref:Hsp70 family protein n=1 Tax=Rhodococcus sp. P1Y TaxID=1302308 RepID=UPI001F17EBB3|nr:Hsp70 family protein [Rhodococcus sp. P1Y]
MSAGLGIRIGTVTSVAALDTSHDPYAPRDFAADEAMPTVVRRSALDLRPGVAPALADLRDRQQRHLLGGFADRVGDPVPLIDEEGRSYLAEDLFATATRALVAEVAAGAATEPAVVVTHPDRWSAYTADVLREALGRAGVPDATLVPESFASMRWLEAIRGEPGDGLTVVYDLGATSLSIMLMRTGFEAGAIGNGVQSQDFGGAQFDHLITQYVLEGASSSQSFEFDPFDPDTVGALVELRARCGEAKEQLSYDTATTLTVELPGLRSETRLVRDEIEGLFRQPILDSVELIREALHAAGLDISDVSQVLLTGGSSSIPLVAELISSELRTPVVSGPHPDRIPAIGGAIIANEVASSVVADLPPAPLPTEIARPATRPAPIPTATASAAPGMSGRKKAGIVFASVAALVVIAGGGLSVGTALTSKDTPVETVSENTAGTTSATEAPATTAAVVADTGQTATTENGLPAPTVAADGTLIPAAGTIIAPDGTVVADPNAPAAPVVGNTGQAPAPAAPAAPNVSVPNPGGPNVSVPSQQAPTYTPPTYNGPTLGDVGNGAGGVVSDLGNGVGGLTGGVVDGLGNVVGGLTGPLTGGR